MTLTQQILFEQILRVLTQEQRDEMISSILAGSGRDKADKGSWQDDVEDDVIDMIRSAG